MPAFPVSCPSPAIPTTTMEYGDSSYGGHDGTRSAFSFAVSSSRHTSPEPALQQVAEEKQQGQQQQTVSQQFQQFQNQHPAPCSNSGSSYNGATPVANASAQHPHLQHPSGFPDLSFFAHGQGSAGNKGVGSPYGTTPPNSAPTPGAASSTGSIYAGFLASPQMQQQQQQQIPQQPRSPYPPFLQMQNMLNRAASAAAGGQPGQPGLAQSQSYPSPAASSFPQHFYQTQRLMMENGLDGSGSGIGSSNISVLGGLKQESAMLDDVDVDDDDEDSDEDDDDDGQSSFGGGEENGTRKRRKSGTRAGNNKRNRLEESPAFANSKKGKAKAAAAAAAAKQDEGSAEPDPNKNKSTRGSRACTVCRRLKMRCEPTGNDKDTKCKRCKHGNHECVFEESQRGRRKNQKTDAMARSIKNMENTLETVLKSIAAGNANVMAGVALGSDGHLVPGAADMLVQLGQQQQQEEQQQAQQAQQQQQQYQSQELIVDGGNIVLPPLPMQAPPPRRQSTSGSAVLGIQQQQQQQPPTMTIEELVAAGAGGGGQNGSSASTSRMVSIKVEEGLPQQPANSSPAMRLHTLPEPENTWAPLGLLAEASLENNNYSRARRNTALENATAGNGNGTGNMSFTESVNDGSESGRRSGEQQDEEKKFGVANDAYFQPGPFNVLPLRQLMIDKNFPSPLLTDKIITIEEAVYLFNLYHQHLSMHTGHFLLEDFHTPMNVSTRSTFLFTAICAIASKFYEPRPELYSLCMPIARKLASEMIDKGYKSVEIVQGYMLLSLYNTPCERFEDDRTWTYSGLAIRMAVELALWRNPKAPTDMDEEGIANFNLEVLNRERTWVYIFVMDRSHSTQTGRPVSLRTGPFERNIKAWAVAPSVRPSDAGVAAILAIYMITSSFQELLELSCFSASADTNGSILDYTIVTKAMENALETWAVEWSPNDAESLAADPTNRGLQYRAIMKDFYFHWHRLLAFSFALQQILKSSPTMLAIMPFFLPCYHSATKVLELARDELQPKGFLKYAQDIIFIYISYASVFLLKLLRPELADCTDSSAIFAQVDATVKCLEQVSVDDTHTPALYAGFLRALLLSKQGNERDASLQDITLDPALTSKLLESQRNGQTVPETSAFLSNNADHHMNGVDGTLAQQMEPSASIYHQLFSAEAPSGMQSADAGGHWNLDQLGQSGFWENLSMPGLGSPPTYGLSAGHLFQGDPWPFSMPNSAAPSRNASPKFGASSLAHFTIPGMSNI